MGSESDSLDINRHSEREWICPLCCALSELFARATIANFPLLGAYITYEKHRKNSVSGLGCTVIMRNVMNIHTETHQHTAAMKYKLLFSDHVPCSFHGGQIFKNFVRTQNRKLKNTQNTTNRPFLDHRYLTPKTIFSYVEHEWTIRPPRFVYLIYGV